MLNNVYNLKLTTTDLPAIKTAGKSILQFSDLHVGNLPIEYLKQVVNVINSCAVDYVVFTGDIVSDSCTELSPEVLQILSKIRHKVYAILGNHDYDLYRRTPNRSKLRSKLRIVDALTSECGWKYLINDAVELDGFWLAGTDDRGSDKWSLNRGCIKKSMIDVPKDEHLVVLTHNPSYVDEIVEYCNPNIILCGHTHSGQIGWDFRLFGKRFSWSLASKYKYWKGISSFYSNNFNNRTDIIVNAGVGWDVLPIRTFRPEITIINF